MSIVLQFYPNGEFSQGVDTSRRRKERAKKERKHEPLTQECRDGYMQWIQDNPSADIHLCVPGQQFMNKRGETYTYLCEDINGHHYALEGENFVLPDVLINEPVGRMLARGELTPLVYQSVESSPQPPENRAVGGNPPQSRKRLEGMTKNMGRNIRNAVYLLEQYYGKHLLSFLTLTLPNLSLDDLGKCCERWDYMVDQFLKWLRKRLQKQNIEMEYVYCTEIQPERLQRRGEYAPHLHLVFRGKYAKKRPWAVTPAQCRKAWSAIIGNVLGHRNFVKSALEKLHGIKKSAARYLSKYLSKGKCVLPRDSDSCVTKQLRTQWGGMARFLSRLVKARTRRIHDGNGGRGLGIHIIRRMEEAIAAGLVRYFSSGEIVLGKCSITGMERVLKVGCGCLATPTETGGLERLLQFVGSYELSEVSYFMVRGLAEGFHGCG